MVVVCGNCGRVLWALIMGGPTIVIRCYFCGLSSIHRQDNEMLEMYLDMDNFDEDIPYSFDPPIGFLMPVA